MEDVLVSPQPNQPVLPACLQPGVSGGGIAPMGGLKIQGSGIALSSVPGESVAPRQKQTYSNPGLSLTDYGTLEMSLNPHFFMGGEVVVTPQNVMGRRHLANSRGSINVYYYQNFWKQQAMLPLKYHWTTTSIWAGLYALQRLIQPPWIELQLSTKRPR